MTNRENHYRLSKERGIQIFFVCVLLMNFHANHTGQCFNQENKTHLSLLVPKGFDNNAFRNSNATVTPTAPSEEDSTYWGTLVFKSFLLLTVIIYVVSVTLLVLIFLYLSNVSLANCCICTRILWDSGLYSIAFGQLS